MSGVMSDNKNVAIIVVVVVVVVVLAFYLLRKREGFDGETTVASKVAVEAVPVAMNQPAAPKLDLAVGSLVDGPGAESGPIGVASGAFVGGLADNQYMLSDGSGGAFSVQNNLCSPSCCTAQWPGNFHQKSDPYVCAALKNQDLIPSRMMCNNVFNSAGCMCLTKNQGRFLYNRGSNSRDFF